MNQALLHYKFKRWLKLSKQEFLAPLTDRTARLQLLSIPFLLIIIFNNEGLVATQAFAKSELTTLHAFLYALPTYAVFCLIMAGLSFHRVENQEGRWINNAYVYNLPQVIMTVRTQKIGKNEPIKFKVSDLIKGGFAELSVKSEGLDSNIKVALLPSAATNAANAPSYPPDFILETPETRSISFVSEDSTYYLYILKDNQNPSIIRVYLHSFGYQ